MTELNPSNLVAQLREQAPLADRMYADQLMRDAADEIERLTRERAEAIDRLLPLGEEVERLRRELDMDTDSFRTLGNQCANAEAERDRLRTENARLRAGLELIAKRDTDEGFIARETLAGRGPVPAGGSDG